MHISVTGTWVKWSFEDFFATFHPSENPQSTKTLWTIEAIVFYRSEIKSRNILKMKQAWRQKSETLNRLSLSTVSLEGSSFPSGVPLFQQSFIRFQETLYVVLAGSLGKKYLSFHHLWSLTVCVPRLQRRGKKRYWHSELQNDRQNWCHLFLSALRTHSHCQL